MGLFSSKTVYSGEVVTNLAIPFEDHEDFAYNAIMTGILTDKSMTHTIKDSVINGFSMVAHNYYRYGRDKYLFGLPTGTLRSGEIVEAPIKEAIEGIRGREVAIDYVFLDYLDPVSMAMHYLDVNYKFDAESLLIHQRINPNTTGEFEQYFLHASLLPDEDSILIEYLYNDTLQEMVYEIPSFDRNQLYITAAYRVPSEDGRLRIWLYRTDSGLYPAIQVETLFTESEYFPVCAVRREFENVRKGTEEYRTAREMLNIIGLNIDDVIGALSSDGSEADANPPYPPTTPGDDLIVQRSVPVGPIGIQSTSRRTTNNVPDENIPEEIRDAFVTFKADINSADQWVRKYLFEYFKDQAAFQLPLEYTKDRIENGEYHHVKINELIIENEIIQSNIFFNYVILETKEGVVGDIGEVHTVFTIRDPIQYSIPFKYDEEIQLSTIEYKKQISPTHYESVLVHGPVHTHDIGGKYVVIRTLEDAIEPDNDTGFYIPVSKRVVDRFSNPYHQSQIYQSTLSIVVYALDSQKVKWYARGFFALLLQIISIVITIWSAGSQSWTLSWAAALQVVAQILIHIVINMVLTFGMRVITDIIGTDAALILAAALAAYSIYSGAFSSSEGMPWAQDMLALSNATFGAVQKVFNDAMLSLSHEYEELLAEAEERYDEIEEINAMLHNEGYSLIDIVTRSNNEVFWESPEMFFNRTIHIGNPGIGVLGAIEVYIENKLDLPKDKPLF